jgi:hypothetical protein
MRRNRDALSIVLGVFTPVAMYVGAYYVMVGQFIEPSSYTVGTYERKPHYELFGHWLDNTFVPKLFHPIHRADVRIRERYWIAHNEPPRRE